jgi:YVTN family beta-propeller protein
MKRIAAALCLSSLLATTLLLAREPATTQRVGDKTDAGGIVVSSNQLIRPVGVSVDFPGRPVDVAVSAKSGMVYFKDDRGLTVVEPAKWTILQELKYPAAEGGSMHGIAITRDGKKLYVGGTGQTLFEGNIADDGTVKWGKMTTLTPRPPEVAPGAEIEGAQPKAETKKKRGSYPCGIALSPDEKTAYVCLSINNTIGIVDLETYKMTGEIPVGVAPFAVVLSPDGKTAYVSNWGGRRAKAGDKTAQSAGTATVIDARGIAASGTVGIIDLSAKKQVTEIAVGLHPAAMAMTKDGATLYVANANSDTVSVIDTANKKVRENILVRPDSTLPFGSASNALALSPDEKTLFVANGGNNAVAVVDLSGGAAKVQGFIPAGWYPGAVACNGKSIFIANVKGIGSRDQAKVKTGWQSKMFRGTVTKVDVPDAATLAKYTEQVRADARVPESLAAFERAEAGAAAVAIPKHPGEPSLIEHVVYVIKENRTYDQVFGDAGRGNGDPKLCTFGKDVTPNHHALADQFVLLDNFYCNGVLSADGHQWAMEGAVTDGLEKSFGGFARSYPFSGDDPLAFVPSGFIWDNALLHGKSFRNYGEMGTAALPPNANFQQIHQDWLKKTDKISYKLTTANETLRQYTHPQYPGWNLTIPDVVRARIFLKELKEFEAKGKMPNLMIVFLPSDHTRGTTAGAPTPAAMVADNDLALGQVIEGISKSKFWPKTAIFVIEDDPQAGFDHVDGHRSLCLVASPYTKRGALVTNFYNQTSVLHTMELILGLPPMNQMDAMAPVMRECFTDKADLKPYTALANKVPLDQLNKKAPEKTAAATFEALSEAQRWDIPDAANEDALNRIIWFAQKGETEAYPASLAGAHGKGLKKLGLSLTAKAKKGKDDDDDDD